MRKPKPEARIFFLFGVTLWVALTLCQIGWLPFDWSTMLKAVWATIATMTGWQVGQSALFAFRCRRMAQRLAQAWRELTPHERQVLADQGIHTPEQWIRWRIDRARLGPVEYALTQYERRNRDD